MAKTSAIGRVNKQKRRTERSIAALQKQADNKAALEKERKELAALKKKEADLKKKVRK